jgi:hypothetical protein
MGRFLSNKNIFRINKHKNIYHIKISMDTDETETITQLREEIHNLQDELNKTKEHLKKYTAPSNMKKYYDNHKEEIKQKVKDYKEKTNYVYNPSKEQKKKWARTAYLNKKAKNAKEHNDENVNV